MKRKCLVLGTSNSIVKSGWYEGFTSSFQGDVERCAIGGAPFTQFLGRLEKRLEPDFDFVLVDTSPNDEAHGNKVGSSYFFRCLYRDFISAISAKTTPIILRIPPLDYLGKDSPLSASQREICLSYGGEFIDLSDKLVEAESAPYRDKYHPKTELAFKIGTLIGQELNARSFERPTRRTASTNERYFEVKASGEGLERENISTAILNEDFYILKTGDSLKLGKYQFGIGFFVHAGRTNCVIRLHGVANDRDIWCFFDQKSGANKVNFVPIMDGFTFNAISVVRPWHTANFALNGELPEPPYELSLGNIVCHTSGI